MDNIDYFKSLTESIPVYEKIVLLIFIFQNDKDSLREIDFSERDNIPLNLEFKKILKEHHEKYLNHVKNDEESAFDRFSNK